MCYQGFLYGLVCEFKSLCQDFVISFFEKKEFLSINQKSVVISQTDEGNKVWVRLECLATKQNYDPGLVPQAVFEPQSMVFSASVLPELTKWLESSLAQGHRLLVLDCHRVRLIESTGLAVLLTLQKLAKIAEATLVLCAISKQFQMVLEMTDTLQLFSTYDSRDALHQVLSTAHLSLASSK
jgi:anti-anti-sigma factor